MIQQLETTLRAGAVPQAPQFRPSTVTSTSQPALVNKPKDSSNNQSSGGANVKEAETKQKDEAAKSAGTKEKFGSVAGDPLGDARSKVQEEIGREFAAIMATGTLRASEAAALATRRVMQRYGLANVAQS